jgi:UDP:flavonoid glycosyltransferase YjiC (YdhE family)
VTATPAQKRILLSAWGSFGDLHPFIALALGLRERGHHPVLAGSEVYREKIEGEGIEFHPMRPKMPPPEEAAEMVTKVMDSRSGSEYVMRELLMPFVRDQYEDLLPLVGGADLTLTHSVAYGAQLAAQVLDRPWLSVVLQPMLFFSPYDPPAPPSAPGIVQLLRIAPWLAKPLLNMGKQPTMEWTTPLRHLRHELGLDHSVNPIFAGQFSPHGTLAMFSEVLGAPQPDWPVNTTLCGFPFYDSLEPGKGMSPELEAFLAEGPPPIVFTLGSSAVMAAGGFYAASVEAAQRLGRRAVLLVGREEWNQIGTLPEGVIAFDYAPYSQLFPHAAAIVHQGGVGTTAQALAAGKPTLIAAFAHDQPDHGTRIERLGVGRWMMRQKYTADSAERELRRLLEDRSYAIRAEEVAQRIRAEDGITCACDTITQFLASRVG